MEKTIEIDYRAKYFKMKGIAEKHLQSYYKVLAELDELKNKESLTMAAAIKAAEKKQKEEIEKKRLLR